MLSLEVVVSFSNVRWAVLERPNHSIYTVPLFLASFYPNNSSPKIDIEA